MHSSRTEYPSPDLTETEVVSDYDDFVAKWGGKIRQMVASKPWFQRCDVDDITQDLLTEFYSRDYLHVYNPDMPNSSKFSTFVYNFTNRRLMGIHDRYVRKTWREGLSLYKTLDDEADTLYVDMITSTEPDMSFEFLDICRGVYRKLRQTPVTSVVNDYPSLFVCIVRQLFMGISPATLAAIGPGEIIKSGRYGINRKALAYELGVSESAISIMMKGLAAVPAVQQLLIDVQTS